jgi:hypothetical protein
MRKTIVTVVDDLDGTLADETVRFTVDGEAFEIDLSAANAATLRASLSTWTGSARRLGAARREIVTRRVALPASGQSRSALIRAWAAENGYTVPACGRIPHAVVAAYDAAA